MIQPTLVIKAFICWYAWSDHPGTGTIVYGKTASKARYKFNLEAENDWIELFNVRMRRDPDHDLVEHPHRSTILDSLNDQQLAKMLHTIGNDLYSPQPYRNHYQSPNDADMDYLVSKGLAVTVEHLHLPYYHLTELGISVIRSSKPIFRATYEQILNLKETNHG